MSKRLLFPAESGAQDGRVPTAIPRFMRAMVFRGPNTLRLEELPVPRIGGGELLVKVAACGVCPTDIKKIVHGTVPAPRVFGHETSGTIVRVGGLVRGFRVGDRVALHHHVPCRRCHFCRHAAYAQCATYKRTGITAGFEPAGGGYAEYVRVMSFCLPGVVKIPRENTFEEGAMLEPVNTVLKAVRRLSLMRRDVVWVIGQGPIGLILTRLFRLSGVRVIASDLVEARRQLARQWGAGTVLAGDDHDVVDQVRNAAGSHGVDAVVLAVPSNPAVQQGMAALRGGGKLLLFAHTRRGDFEPMDLASVCVDEKDVLGSYSSDVTLQTEVARLVFSRRLDVRGLMTHRFPLEETAQAVALAARPSPDALKVMVRVAPAE